MGGPSANLVKWWAKRAFEEGTVRRHLSPNEIYPLKSLIESMPSKAIRKVRENGAVLIPAALLLFGTISWGNYANDQDHRSHRS